MADQGARATAVIGRQHMVFHQVIGKIGKWIAERGEFPIENREDLRRVRRQDGVVKAKIAVD